MKVDVQEDIINHLKAHNGSLSFEQIKTRTGWNGHEVRAALKELLQSDSGVYVSGVEEREKQYDYKG